jgi:hypothetical protein
MAQRTFDLTRERDVVTGRKSQIDAALLRDLVCLPRIAFPPLELLILGMILRFHSVPGRMPSGVSRAQFITASAKNFAAQFGYLKRI